MNKLFIDHNIEQLIEMMKKGELTPSDLKDATVANIKELDPKFFAWVMYQDEKWKAPQPPAPMDGPLVPEKLLHNIPIGVKDIYNTYDFPTQMGSPLWKGYTPGNDARTVFNLKRQGAVVMGKTVTAEFAVHALNQTLNPYDTTKTPGTSSSGSAVAISLGMVPLATGSQTAGSIVRPASFCGVYGVKPSFGSLPRTGTLKTTDSLDTLGYFAIHQRDLRRGFDAMRVSGLDYPILHAALSNKDRQTKPKGRPWKVGFSRTHTWKNAPQYAQEALEKYMNQLANLQDIEIVDANLPVTMEKAHSIHKTIYDKALSYYFKGEYKQSDFVSPIMNEIISRGKEVPLKAYTDAVHAQMDLLYDMDDYFTSNNFDVLISLSTAGEAPLREIEELPDPALMWTLTHLPVVSVPKFTSPNGLPFGFQITARKYNDYLLFDFLDHLESEGVIPPKGGYFVNAK